MRLVLMGTGRFALPTFEALLNGRHKVVGLFTQPDRTGRGHHRHAHPMKDTALAHDVPVFQPSNVNVPESLEQLRSLDPELCVVAAYGQILSAELLATPAFGAINVHASLLPKYRGAAPVQYAILQGETETGVTIFQIEPKLDAGPMLGALRISIHPTETAGDLEERLAQLAAPPTTRVVDQIASGTTEPIVQDKSQVSKAPRLTKQSGLIDWSRTAGEIDRHVRGMQPWPTGYTFLCSGHGSQRVILRRVQPVESSALTGDAPAGTVLAADETGLVVACGSGAVQVIGIQPDGKRTMTAADFLRGHPVQPGDRFGES